MSMTGSMCVSMTGRPTFAQRQNEQRRQSYGYYQTAKTIKEQHLDYANRQPMRDGLEIRNFFDEED